MMSPFYPLSCLQTARKGYRKKALFSKKIRIGLQALE
jgi:hypothetical protein